MGKELFNDIYNPRINDLAASCIEPFFISRPDVIAEGQGDYCGDMCSYRIRLNQELIEVEPQIEACILAKASMKILLGKVQGQTIEEALSICKKGISSIINKSVKDNQIKELEYFFGMGVFREHCILLPWRIMERGLEMLQQQFSQVSCSLDKRLHDANRLACDSCVSTSVIQVAPQKDNEVKKGLKRFISGLKEREYSLKLYQGDIVTLPKNIYRKTKKLCGIHVGRLGKLHIDSSEMSSLAVLLDSWDDSYVALFREFRSPAIVAHHIQCGLKRQLPDKLAKFLDKRIKMMMIYKAEWKRISQTLTEKGILFCGVKGIATHHLYPATGSRIFSDIDILVSDLETFFRISSVLKYELGYDFSKELGQSASLKKMKPSFSGEGEYIITGHAHMERLINGVFVEIDISFPNLPSTPHSILSSNIDYKNPVCDVSNLFLINIDHSLKHTHQPMRDINDCYILLKTGLLNLEYLEKSIVSNGLEFIAEGILRTLEKHYDVSESAGEIHLDKYLSLFDKLMLALLKRMNWPFSNRTHKLMLFYNKMRKARQDNLSSKYGITKQTGRSEMSEGYSMLINKLQPGKRMYLIPIISFNRKLDLSEEVFNRIESCSDLIARKLSNNGWLLTFKETNMLLTELGIMLFTERFELSQDIVDIWVQSYSQLITLLNIPANSYRVRLNIDYTNRAWVFK